MFLNLCSVLPLTLDFLHSVCYLTPVDLALWLRSLVFLFTLIVNLPVPGCFCNIVHQASSPSGSTRAPLQEEIRLFQCIVKAEASIRKLLGLCKQWLWKSRSWPLPGCEAAEPLWQRPRTHSAEVFRFWGQSYLSWKPSFSPLHLMTWAWILALVWWQYSSKVYCEN